MKKIIVIICTLSLFATTVSAITPWAEITNISPTNPEPLDTITFTVLLHGNLPITSSLIVQECNFSTGICYPVQNISLPGNLLEHTVDVTLTHADATYISYWVTVKEGSAWNTSNITKLNLTINNNGEGDVDVGIRLIVIFIILVVCFVLGYFGFKILMKKWEK